jgi:hypothetical protein
VIVVTRLSASLTLVGAEVRNDSSVTTLLSPIPLFTVEIENDLLPAREPPGSCIYPQNPAAPDASIRPSEAAHARNSGATIKRAAPLRKSKVNRTRSKANIETDNL